MRQGHNMTEPLEMPVYPVQPDDPQPCGMAGCTRDADYFTPVDIDGVTQSINVAACIEHLPDMAQSIAAARGQ